MSTAPRKGFVLKYRVPHGAVGMGSGGPYAIAERIGRYSAGWRWPTALGATVLAHAVLALLAYLGDQQHRRQLPPRQQVVTLERPPPEPAPPPPEPEPPPPRRPRPTSTAAQAGKVVTAVPDANQPVDLTSFSMPVGTSDSYAGGFTAPGGASAVAVTERPPVRPPRGGKARPAGPARRDWSCPWPDEETSGDLHDVSVRIRVQVGVDGRARSVDVLDGARASFADAARACALAEPFRPELDDAGRAVVGATPQFAVHFVR